MPNKLAIPIILDRETSDNHRYSQENKDGETAVIQLQPALLAASFVRISGYCLGAPIIFCTAHARILS
jgi:hypothetical protein